MSWTPISENDLLDTLYSSEQRMTPVQRRFWDLIRIKPQKWLQHPYGDLGGGFWAIALLGRTVVWFNDIEDGFNRSEYATYGEIGAYWCNQDQLEHALGNLLQLVFEESEKAGG